MFAADRDVLSRFWSGWTCSLSQSSRSCSQRAGLQSESSTADTKQKGFSSHHSSFCSREAVSDLFCPAPGSDRTGCYKSGCLILLVVFVRVGPCATSLPFAGPCAPGVRPTGRKRLVSAKQMIVSLPAPIVAFSWRAERLPTPPSLHGSGSTQMHKCSVPSVTRPESKVGFFFF